MRRVSLTGPDPSTDDRRMTATAPIEAIVLAAGSSSRLGRPKALVELGGRTVLERRRVEIGGRTGPVLDPDLLERDVELLGHERAERGEDALAHLGARRDDGDRVVRADLHIGIEGCLALGEIVLQRIVEGLLVFVIAEGGAA